MYLKTKNPNLSTKVVLGMAIALIAIIMTGCSMPTTQTPATPEEQVTVTRAMIENAFSDLSSDSTYNVVVTGESTDAYYNVTISGAFNEDSSEDLIVAISTALITYSTTKIALDLSGITGVTEIIDFAFGRCTNLTSMILPDTVTSIAGVAFQDCTSLESVSIPNTVEFIDAAVFNGCTSLKTINIPSSLEAIKEEVFMNCSSLESITIPAKVRIISQGAFEGCNNLNSVTFEDTSNWKVEDQSSDDPAISLTTANLSNRETAATYLKDTYCTYLWNKTE